MATPSPGTRAIPAEAASGAPITTAPPRDTSPDEFRTRVIEVPDAHLQRLREAPPISIVVPVYNAPRDLERCLESLLRNTTGAAEVLLINDASPDPAIGPLLQRYESTEGVRVLRNAANRGFPATVNRGFEETDGDVVILNSDTEVTPRWLQNLAFAAQSDERVATVTPLSDNAGAFSVPEVGAQNSFPRNLTPDDVGRMFTRGSRRAYPSIPTGSGFCMYVKRAAIDAIGVFDEEAFERGYGEENDFCMRALRAGWTHLLDDTTLIFHERKASFGGEEAETRIKSTREILDRRYPEYTGLIRRFVHSTEMNEIREQARAAFSADARGAEKPRVLFILHAGGGGTPQTSQDLAGAIADRYECFLLTSDTHRLRLIYVDAEGPEELESWVLPEPLKARHMRRADYRVLLASILASYSIELVHVRHLFKHTFDPPAVAEALGIPVVMSFHDFFFVCPTVNLMDDNLTYCGGVCTPGIGDCYVPSEALKGLPALKHQWVYRWREESNRLLESVDACVTTSEHTKDVHDRALDGLGQTRFEVIEHGRNMEQRRGLSQRPDPDEPIRILVPGNLRAHKGGIFLRALKAHDTEDRLELHLAGWIQPGLEDLGKCHGTYNRNDFHVLVKRITPSFVGAFSIFGETYSHVLTEAWGAGVPVLASDIGTLRERVREHGGGWLIDHRDPARAYDQIIEISENPEQYEEVAAAATLEGTVSTAEMADSYDRLYREVARSRCSFAPRGRERRASDRVPRVGMFLVGQPGDRPGSAHVRCVRPLSHPGLRTRVQAVELDAEAFLDGTARCDIVLVQRDAVPVAQVPSFLEAARERGVPIVFELDDNLLESDPDEVERHDPLPDPRHLTELAAASSAMTVSTPPLFEIAQRHANRVRLVPNALDERLWMPAYPDSPFSANGHRDGGEDRFRVLYMGTTTHSADLALLKPAVEELRANGVPLDLEVIGGEPRYADTGWYRRVEIPPGNAVYPRFVRWLRSEAGRWSAAVAPLRDTSFTACKSDLKFLEYSALGLPGVYSDVGVYASCVHAATGLLAENTVESWIEALGRLYEDVELRGQLAVQAHEYVATKRCLTSADWGHIGVFTELI